MKGLIVAAVMCVMASAALYAQMPVYGVTVTVAKGVDPGKFKTYSWTKGGPSPDKAVDKQLVAAIDKELAGVRMTKAASGKPDVLVTYFSLRRTDVNLEAKPNSAGALPQYPVGTLLIATDPGLVSGLVQPYRQAGRPDPAKLEAVINGAVAEMFAKYPTTQKKP